MRAYLILAAVAAMAALSGCATTPQPVADPAIPKATPQSAALWHDLVEESDRAAEISALKRFPHLARREGVDLYILRKGAVVAKRTSDPQNCGGFYTCRLWLFHDGIDLKDTTTGKIQTFAQLALHHGEGELCVIIDGKGNDYEMPYVGLASPDGRLIASGLDCADCDYRLTINDWTGKQEAVAFAITCRPVAWKDPRQFSADCEFYDDNKVIDAWAEISQSDDGQWHLKEVDAVDHETGVRLAGRPLKTWKAEVVQ